MSSQTSATATLDGSSSTITDGMRVRKAAASPQPAYLMINERAHLLTDQVAQNNLFGNTDSTPVEELVVSIGAAIGDGYLAKSSESPAVYLVYDGYKRWIPSPTVFEQFGFSWGLIRDVPASELNAIPNGPDVG
jgi:hypothetical protein